MAASHRPSMFYASVPGQHERSTHDSAHSSPSETQIESRLQSIVSSVNFIQEQSDEAISISNQASHCIKALVDQLGEVDSRVKALEASSTSPTSTHRNRIPRELSVSYNYYAIFFPNLKGGGQNCSFAHCPYCFILYIYIYIVLANKGASPN